MIVRLNSTAVSAFSVQVVVRMQPPGA